MLRGESALVHFGNLVAGVNLCRPVQVRLLLVDVVLLQELGALDLVCLQQLQIAFYSHNQRLHKRPALDPQLTSQVSAVLKVVNTLSAIALSQLIADQSSHHSANPLFSDDGVFGGLESLGVIVLNAVEGGSDGGLLSLELGGFGSRHCEGGN